MKKLILFLLLIYTSSIVFSQTYYKATITEMYTINRNTNEWTLYQKNSDVNITVVVEEEFISFQAKTPTMYKIYLNSKEPFNTKSLKGFRYSGRDLKRDNNVTVDVLASAESQIGLISIIDLNDGYNFRFFLTKIIDQ